MSILKGQGQRWLSSASGSLDQVACLKEVRNVLRLSGPTLIHFLQGLLTNDVTLLEKPNPSPLYSCILNAQGRYLHDLFLHPLSALPAETTGAAAAEESNSSGSPTLLLDIDSNGKNDLIRLLKRYRLREKIEIDDVSEDFQVWTRFRGTPMAPFDFQKIENKDHEKEANESNNGKLSSILASSSLSWPVDPRLPRLGLRTILPTSLLTTTTISPPLVVDIVKTETTSENIDIVPWDAYRRLRISLGIAEGDVEIPSSEAIALEYNIDGLNGISFTKGCYVGQELMARTHFKGVVRKRVMPVSVIQMENGLGTGNEIKTGNAEKEAETGALAAVENIVDSDSGKILGSLRVLDTETGQGLALLRLKEAQEAIEGQRVLKTELTGVKILPRRPEWWPNAWGREQ